jgi:hypothetical protein
MNNMKYEKYAHHGATVSVRSDLKGTHREHCLCFACALFDPSPDRSRSCSKANELYALCQRLSLVTPVFECPDFVQAISEE